MPQEQNGPQQNPQSENTFGKGLNKDMADSSIPEGCYTHARNATTVLPDGQQGFGIHTECANIAQTVVPYVLTGIILLHSDEFILFSTNDTFSEIGLYVEGTGAYATMLNDSATIAAGLPGMGFKTTHLITGAARRNFDCGFDIYWADNGLNPDRMLDTAYLYPNPWVQDCSTIATCITCVNTNLIDIEQLRSAPQFTVPCLTLAKSPTSGTLPNGSYQVTARFAINSIPCTNFLALSNIQPTFTHNNNGGSLILNISGISTETTIIFPEIEVVVISMNNSQVQAKRLGFFNSTQKTIYIDNINQELVNIPINELPVSNPVIEKSNAIYSVGDYLLKVGTYEKPDFNYQPLANQIIPYWVAVQYPDQYYRRGGNNGFAMNVSYLRGEVYALYIRWVYTTGDKSASYHIPGLPAGTPPTLILGGPSTGDGGITIASGRFEGYSSTLTYPSNEPEIWGPLCGQAIKHHRFPKQTSFGAGTSIMSHFNPNGTQYTISVLGVYFDNIKPPVDINGNVIPNIQGYEILRATRDGNASVIANGMVNHMRGYNKPDGTLGAYQNYPYDDLNPDGYLCVNPVPGGVANSYPELGLVFNNLVSFHSPDTTFEHPYLGTGSLDFLQVMSGTSTGMFHECWKHPKFKLLTDQATRISVIIDTIATLSNLLNIISGGGTNLQIAATQSIPMVTPLGFSAIADGSVGAVSDGIYIAGLAATGLALAIMLPFQFRVLQEQILNIITGLVPEIQFAWQYDSHGFYNNPVPVNETDHIVADYEYIKGHLQSFNGIDINNLYRNPYVLMDIAPGLPTLPAPYNTSPLSDASRFTLGQAYNTPGVRGFGFGPYNAPIVSWYAAYTIAQPSQYGDIDSTKQIPIGCMQPYILNSAGYMTSQVLFGGDTYINRYTEKNPFMFFNDWLVDTPDDFQYDYTTVENVPYPRYWVNNSKIYYDFWHTASKNWHLDELDQGTVIFGVGLSLYVKGGYFYLFNNGVRDFYVESTVNVGFRDWEDVAEKRFYDPYGYTSLDYLFRSDIIKSDILYKYDYSLSAGRFWNNYLSWGSCLPRDYNPQLAYSCFAYYPRRIAYSLPQEEEIRKDNWKVFLPNNYKDFSTNVTAIKNVHKTGALILLDDQSPQQFIGTESIASKSDTEFTVGTGLLFNQSLQSIANTDDPYQYGSCQSRLGIVNTPYGLIWASQSTGKVFQYAPNKTYYNQGETMINIGEHGMKYWLSLYMPSMLLQQFPDYALPDNPVAGIGMQLIYDSINEILYICKKDYRLWPQWIGSVLYDPTFGFYTPGTTYSCPIGYTLSGTSCISVVPATIETDGTERFYSCPIGYTMVPGSKPVECQSIIAATIAKSPVSQWDPIYFEDTSWTLSYDLKGKKFISFHDWFPALNVPTKSHFLTTQTSFSLGIISGGDTLWRHNLRTDLFGNYYSVQYPFEIEVPVTTGPSVTTLQSIELVVEPYLYRANQTDKFLQFDTGFFDRAIVFNREQCTGLLELNLVTFGDPYSRLNFPVQDALGTQITYSRIETTWRFNQGLIDLTNDRGEFDISTVQMFNTDGNGYTFTLNTLYFDYFKSWNERKKMRARNSRVFLRKNNPANTALSFLFSRTKNQLSPR